MVRRFVTVPFIDIVRGDYEAWLDALAEQVLNEDELDMPWSFGHIAVVGLNTTDQTLDLEVEVLFDD